MDAERPSNLAQKIADDITIRREEIIRQEREHLLNAQREWDAAEEIGKRFKLEEDLKLSYDKIKTFHDNAKFEKSERPTEVNRSRAWTVKINFGDRLSFGVHIHGNFIRIIGDGRAGTSINADAATKEMLDEAIYNAYKQPQGSMRLD